MSDTIPIILLTIFWTPVYWVIGGTIFAVIVFLSMIKVRKALFSFLFSLVTLLVAFGTAFAGIFWAQADTTGCVVRQDVFIDQLSSVIACGILEISLVGVAGFLALLGVGGIVLYICRAKNQSWVDSDHGVDKKGEVFVFDNKPHSF
jgi:hypothetical protein